MAHHNIIPAHFMQKSTMDLLCAETYNYSTGRSLAVYEAKQYAECSAGYQASRLAASSWKNALSNHAETSFWGVAHIRNMRGFWLGVARTISQRTP